MLVLKSFFTGTSLPPPLPLGRQVEKNQADKCLASSNYDLGLLTLPLNSVEWYWLARTRLNYKLMHF